MPRSISSDLASCANELVTAFSYGHQRLIEIARALAANPTLLLLDEPAAGLNSTESRACTIARTDRGFRPYHSHHRPRHDAGSERRKPHHGAQLGRRIADGESMAVLRHPDVISAYLELNDGLARDHRPVRALRRDRGPCAASRSASTRQGRDAAGLQRRPASRRRCALLSGLAQRPPTARSSSTDIRSPASAPKDIVRKGIAHVPEGRRVFPGLSVRENIMLGASNRRDATATIRRRPTTCR